METEAPGLLPPGRVRVSRACKPCQASRRKCDGNQPCSYCQRRGVACDYDSGPPKKRGPKKGAKAMKVEEENERLRAELAVLKARVGGEGADAGTSTGSAAGGGSQRSASAGAPVGRKRGRPPGGGPAGKPAAGAASAPRAASAGRGGAPKRPRLAAGAAGGPQARYAEDDAGGLEGGHDGEEHGLDHGAEAEGLAAGGHLYDYADDTAAEAHAFAHALASSGRRGRAGADAAAAAGGRLVVDGLTYGLPASSAALALAAAERSVGLHRRGRGAGFGRSAGWMGGAAAGGPGAAGAAGARPDSPDSSEAVEALAALSDVGSVAPSGSIPGSFLEGLPGGSGVTFGASHAGMQLHAQYLGALGCESLLPSKAAMLRGQQPQYAAPGGRQTAAAAAGGGCGGASAAELAACAASCGVSVDSVSRGSTHTTHTLSGGATAAQHGHRASSGGESSDGGPSRPASVLTSHSTSSISVAAHAHGTASGTQHLHVPSPAFAGAAGGGNASLLSSNSVGSAHGGGFGASSSSSSSGAAKHVASSSGGAATAAAAASGGGPGVDLQANVWAPPGPIIPSADELSMLRTYFAFTNKILRAVDEDYFWAALEEARYYDDPAAAAGEGELLDGEGDRDAAVQAARAAAGGGAGAGAGAGQVVLETPLGDVTQAGIAARVELEQRMQAPPHQLAAAAAAVERQASSTSSRPSPLAAVAPPSNSGTGEGHGSTPRADDPRLLDEAEALGALAAAPRRVTAPLEPDRDGASPVGGPLGDAAAAPTAASAGEALAALSLAPSPTSASATSAGAASAALSAAASAADGAHKKQAQVIAARAVQMHRRMHLLQRNSEAYGFRVCYFMLLCVGAKTQGKLCMARHYYETARAFIGPCFTQPSQHLVSALLLMVAITRSVCCDVQQAALHASLALRMTELVDGVGPEIRAIAECFNVCNSTATTLEWPPLTAPIGQPYYRRLGTLFGFLTFQLSHDFQDVDAAHVPAFMGLLAESDALRQQYGVFTAFPHDMLGQGIRAILSLRIGDEAGAIKAARRCVNLAVTEPLCKYCFPCAIVMTKLMPLLKSMATRSEKAPEDAALPSSASNFIRTAFCTSAPPSLANGGGPCGGAGGGDAGSSGAEGAAGDNKLAMLLGDVPEDAAAMLRHQVQLQQLVVQGSVGPKPAGEADLGMGVVVSRPDVAEEAAAIAAATEAERAALRQSLIRAAAASRRSAAAGRQGAAAARDSMQAMEVMRLSAALAPPTAGSSASAGAAAGGSNSSPSGGKHSPSAADAAAARDGRGPSLLTSAVLRGPGSLLPIDDASSVASGSAADVAGAGGGAAGSVALGGLSDLGAAVPAGHTSVGHGLCPTSEGGVCDRLVTSAPNFGAALAGRQTSQLTAVMAAEGTPQRGPSADLPVLQMGPGWPGVGELLHARMAAPLPDAAGLARLPALGGSAGDVSLADAPPSGGRLLGFQAPGLAGMPSFATTDFASLVQGAFPVDLQFTDPMGEVEHDTHVDRHSATNTLAGPPVASMPLPSSSIPGERLGGGPASAADSAGSSNGAAPLAASMPLHAPAGNVSGDGERGRRGADDDDAMSVTSLGMPLSAWTGLFPEFSLDNRVLRKQ